MVANSVNVDLDALFRARAARTIEEIRHLVEIESPSGDASGIARVASVIGRELERIGATVTLADEETDEEQTYVIVGEDEADVKGGKLSVASPLARALIGKGKGDSVEVSTPRGNRSYEVVTVAFG